MGCARPGTRAPWRREANASGACGRRAAYGGARRGAAYGGARRGAAYGRREERKRKDASSRLWSRGLTGSYPNVLDRWKLIGLAMVVDG